MRAQAHLGNVATVFVLVHSPLVGPSTWATVADELRRRGVDALVPVLPQGDSPPDTFWKRDADSVAEAIRQVTPDREVILVGHSGAGPLLPAIREASARPMAAYVFVDAGLPENGHSHLGSGDFAEYLETVYARGERFPSWTDEDLREILPDPTSRRQVLAEVRPQPWAFWTESIPVLPGWPDAPCAYLRFTPNPAYDDAAAEARKRGWPYREMPGGHFHTLVAPAAVAGALVELVGEALRKS